MTGKYLITTDNWFIAPDGKSYRAVWGEAQTMTAVEALGVEPNRNSANWMVRVGTEEHHIILAGCQIHYAVSCPDRPYQGDTSQTFSEDNGKPTVRSNQIYIPEPPGEKEEPKKEVRLIGGGNKVTPALLDLINSLEENIFPENQCKWRLMNKLKMEGIASFNHYYNNSDKCYELYIKFKDESVVIKLY